MHKTPPPSRLRELAAELAEPKPMGRGSLSERTIKCSKPGCAWAHDPKARHGPYFSLTRAMEGKTHSRFLTAEQAALARQQIQTGHEFRTKVEAYWEDCEVWADHELEASATASPPGGRKKGLQTSLEKESPRKSRLS
jgi:hypothetical protein